MIIVVSSWMVYSVSAEQEQCGCSLDPAPSTWVGEAGCPSRSGPARIELIFTGRAVCSGRNSRRRLSSIWRWLFRDSVIQLTGCGCSFLTSLVALSIALIVIVIVSVQRFQNVGECEAPDVFPLFDAILHG
jgi:hypothetical protein